MSWDQLPALLDLRFDRPWVLSLALPWLVFLALFGRSQRVAVRWIERHVDPRFRRRLTSHGPMSLTLHLALFALMGLALLAAAAGPTLPGSTEVTADGGHIVLLLDASASMKATDLAVNSETERKVSRFSRARELARELVRALPESRFAVLTWSGSATLQLPFAADAALIHETLRVVEVHDYYQQTGSSLTAALDAVLALADTPGESPGNPAAPNPGTASPPLPIAPQVVILSDGELPTRADGSQPEDADYSDALAAVAARGIPIHGIALGSLAGQSRVIFDFRDIAANVPKDQRRKLAEFTTRRHDEHLQRLARETDGTFTLDTGNAASRIARAIESGPSRSTWLERPSARRDVAQIGLLFFLGAFLIDAFWIGRGKGRAKEKGVGAGPGSGGHSFDIQYLGDVGSISKMGDGPSVAHRVSPAQVSGEERGMAAHRRRMRMAAPPMGAALALLCLAGASSCRWNETPLVKAHHENEKGIRLSGLGAHGSARLHYERSRSFATRSEIPTHNLALSHAHEEGYAEAHRLFQAALAISPDLLEAHYHDALTLYAWGRAELDPRGCQPERTLDLWRHAGERFENAHRLAAPKSNMAVGAAANRARLASSIAKLEALQASPPAECASPPPSAGGGQEGGGQAGGGQGDGGNANGDGSASQGSAGGEPSTSGPPPDRPQENDQEDGQEGDQGQPPEPGRPGSEGREPPGRNDPTPEDQSRGQPNPSSSGGQPGAQGSDMEQSGAPLSAQEKVQIALALERMGRQRLEAGKYHRRTQQEQFPKSSWQNPSPIIWW